MARSASRSSTSNAAATSRTSWRDRRSTCTRPAALGDAWDMACSDDELYAKWAALEHCPGGSLGQGVWRFYRARGFTYPGRPNSAPPNLAQHDWIHVLADYGSAVESEIEVFGLIARCNDDPRAFSLLAMVLGLFETGYLFDAAKGFFEYDRGHLSRDIDRMAVRLADAMYRGAMVGWHLNDHHPGRSTDLLAADWFEHADRPLGDVRAELGLLPRSAARRGRGLQDRVGTRWHLPLPARTRPRGGRARGSRVRLVRRRTRMRIGRARAGAQKVSTTRPRRPPASRSRCASSALRRAATASHLGFVLRESSLGRGSPRAGAS